MKKLLILLIIVLNLSLAQDVSEINLENWFNHPEIVAARKVYAYVQTKIRSGAMLELKQAQDCGGVSPVNKTMLIETGIPRYYFYDSGSADSFVEYNFYYDTNRHLRFAFIKAGATNGTVLEHRIYFKDDAKIWEIQKLVEGPGYTFPEIWPEEFLAYDPAEAFNTSCK